MRKFNLSLFCLLCCTAALYAQPSNDECSNPIVLNNVTEFCSSAGAYTNVGATPSLPLQSPPVCFGGTTAGEDVWFSFKAQFTDVDITITGAASGSQGGTLKNPQIALYLGDCNGTFNEISCRSDNTGNNITDLYVGGLFVGSNYLIRVQGKNNNVGTFQLCIRNYNPPVVPTSDCPTASRLCDKSPFVVQSVTGAGTNTSEMQDASCFDNGPPGTYETNSTWFVWTCDQSGTLEFTLSPLNKTDDLDFVVYRLPNGVGNCAGKEVVRCMASGESQGNTPAQNAPCLGPTGLISGETDVSAPAGCSAAGENAWLKPLDMVSGESYALVVNNYTSTGNGFSVAFGGTGTFVGPKAEFQTVPAAVCLGIPVQVIDASTFPIGTITNWSWSFGANAAPQTANGVGPHIVQFNTPGVQSVVLSIRTNLGCKVTTIQNVLVYPPVKIDTVIAAPDCNGGTNGGIQITNIKMGTPPYQFSWNGGPFGSNETLSNLTQGTYSLVIKDANNCQTDLKIDVEEKTLKVNADIMKPLCFGDKNGSITLNVINGTSPFLFDWGNGYISSNMESGFGAGVYTILGLDAALCKGKYVVTVLDNPPLTLKLDSTNVSCFGAGDGTATAIPGGGVGNYMYHWSNGQTTAKISNLQPGTYSVTVTDNNECDISGSLTISQPPDVNLALVRVKDLTCNGIAEGVIVVSGSGGQMPYQFSTDGVHYVPSDSLTGLPAGNYWVKIKDAGGCLDSVAATIIQPPALVVVALPSDTTLNLGHTVDILTITAPAGRPVAFEWIPSQGLSCNTCPEPTATAIETQSYVVKITDSTGCVAYDTVLVRVVKDRPVYFPNIFAPDRNYPNDHFTGFGDVGADKITLLRIYDRWGSLIFETHDIKLNEPNFGWDGTYKGQKVDGVFTWYALVHFVDNEQRDYKGSVTVFR